MTLSTDQIAQYRQEGYVYPLRVLEPGIAAGLRSRLEAVEARQGGHLQASQRSKSFLLFKWLDDLIRDARVLDPIEQLIGPDILCWNTIFWIKEPGSTSFVSWHQDATYWGLSSRDVVTAWIALSPATVESGCMKVMPGTHTGEALPHEDTFGEGNMLTRGQTIVSGVDDARAVHMPLAPGEMSLHNYCLAHGSGPNISGDRRIGISMHFMRPETRQVVGGWDSAALVRGVDACNHFERAPVPSGDFDPVALAFHARATGALREVLYAGAKQHSQRL